MLATYRLRHVLEKRAARCGSKSKKGKKKYQLKKKGGAAHQWGGAAAGGLAGLLLGRLTTGSWRGGALGALAGAGAGFAGGRYLGNRAAQRQAPADTGIDIHAGDDYDAEQRATANAFHERLWQNERRQMEDEESRAAARRNIARTQGEQARYALEGRDPEGRSRLDRVGDALVDAPRALVDTARDAASATADALSSAAEQAASVASSIFARPPADPVRELDDLVASREISRSIGRLNQNQQRVLNTVGGDIHQAILNGTDLPASAQQLGPDQQQQALAIFMRNNNEPNPIRAAADPLWAAAWQREVERTQRLGLPFYPEAVERRMEWDRQDRKRRMEWDRRDQKRRDN